MKTLFKNDKINRRIRTKGDDYIRKILVIVIILFACTATISYASLDKIPVLLYHHILPEQDIINCGWENNNSVLSLEKFTEQMEYLKENGYYTATMNELESFIDGKIKLPKKTVVITFDDGYLSNGIYAYPIMKEYGMKGTIFSVGELATREKVEFDPEGLQYIPVEDMGKYNDVFLFACHTYDLHRQNEEGIPFLKSLSEEEIMKDLFKSKELLKSQYIAYPFGEYDKHTIKYVEEAGYKLGFTVSPGYVSRYTKKYEIPRMVINQNIDLDNFISFLK